MVNVVRKNTYFDSVTLMSISKRLQELEGVVAVSVSMGTEMNKQLLADGGFDAVSVENASPNDLMILCSYEDAFDCDEMLEKIEQALHSREEVPHGAELRPKTLSAAVRQGNANVVVISLPGAYAANEAKKAIENNMHVMLFSDNVSIEDEVALKELAHSKGLLMMGPDCGTAIINGKALCFANRVKRGTIGIVAASGTGAQEVSVLLSEAGLGISQLIGTGGRDLSEAVKGRMFFDAFDALDSDEHTTHILLVSKPPHESVLPVIRKRLEKATKPVIACFLGDTESVNGGSVFYSPSLEGAVSKMVSLAVKDGSSIKKESVVSDRQPTGRYLRGLFCGGTLMEETKQIAVAALPEGAVFSNRSKDGALGLEDVLMSQGHTLLDMGDDAFTRGKPHPMIDPQARNERIIAEAKDPDTAVILLDFVLGYGAHENPVGAALPAIHEAFSVAESAGRTIVLVAYVLGTTEDPQNKLQQRFMLEEAGVLVGESNAQTAKAAVSMVKGLIPCQV